MTYDTLSTQSRPFLAMTGLTLAEFRDLLPAFEAAYERTYPPDRTADGRARQRWPRCAEWRPANRLVPKSC